MIIVMNRQLIETASSAVMNGLISNADVSKTQRSSGTLGIKALIYETSGAGDQQARATYSERGTCSMLLKTRTTKISYQLGAT